MKKLLILMMLGWPLLATAQDNQSKIKKIEVRGTAEKEIVPDEIDLRIALKEYKDGSKMIKMNTLEEQLVKAVKKLGIPEKNLTVDNIYGYNWDWKKKKSDEFLATKSFKLRVDNVKKINDLLSLLDPEGINSVGITEATHSRLEEIKMELRIEALKTARKKAEQLLSAIGEQIGGALEIYEEDQNYGPMMYETRMKTMNLAEDSSYQSNLDFKNITITTAVRASFEIK